MLSCAVVRRAGLGASVLAVINCTTAFVVFVLPVFSCLDTLGLARHNSLSLEAVD